MPSSLTVLTDGRLESLKGGDAAAVPAGLMQALASVPDPRRRRGIRHGLVPVLAAAACAVLAGARSYLAIAEWAADCPQRLLAVLGLARAPDLATFWRVLTRVDPAALDAAIGSWAASRAAPPPVSTRNRRVLAVDGKTIRGARSGDARAPHLLACLEHGTGAVLAQVAVDGKTNEIPMFTALLSQVTSLKGILVTADALHAQRDHAGWLHQRGAHYLVTVKANQPSLLAQLRSLPWKDVAPGHVATGRAHGRIERRAVKVVTVAAGLDFPHAAQAICVNRRTRRLTSSKWRSETSYAIISLPAHQAKPDQIAAWLRGHWKIENQLHWVRDVTYGEDGSTARTGNGPHVMASLRNLAITILRLAGHASIATALRRNARDPVRTIRLLDDS